MKKFSAAQVSRNKDFPPVFCRYRHNFNITPGSFHPWKLNYPVISGEIVTMYVVIIMVK